MTDAAQNVDDESQVTDGEDLANQTPEVTAAEPTSTVESAPTEKYFDSEGKEVDLTDLAQKRINKVTANMHGERRRADALQERLDKQEVQPVPVTQAIAPTLESCEFDDARYQSELLDFKLDKRMADHRADTDKAAEKTRKQGVAQTFSKSVEKFTETNPDYLDAIGALPQLPSDTLETIMSLDNGPQVAYFLGKHLDVADEISTASPMMAAIKLGEIRAQLANGKPNGKPSAAPEPITTVTSGGEIAETVDPWLAKGSYS